MTLWDYIAAHPVWTFVYLCILWATASDVSLHLGRRLARRATFTVRCDKCQRVIATSTTEGSDG